jgi:hypothetical protein
MIYSNQYSLRAYKILQFIFVATPIIAGADKFTNLLVNWTRYLSPTISKVIDAHLFMEVVGVIEIGVGLITIFNPRVAGYILALWFLGIIINLLSIPGYLDIALRDLGLLLAALALSELAQAHHY